MTHRASERRRVLVTDYAWPDLEIERGILEPAGIDLVLPRGRSEAELIEAASGVDAIMTNWATTSAAVIGAAPECRIVARLGIGLDNIDVAYCTSRGIPVTNVPDYCVIEVAEHAMALLLALARNVAWYHHRTKQGAYQLQEGPALRRIAGRTLGIVGYGKIGRALADRARAFGLRIVATRRRADLTEPGVEFLPLDDLLSQSDFVSLHVPLTDETRGMISAERLARMKPGACLINTARGGVVDHDGLARSLASGHLAGAGLDVQTPEPPDLSRAPYDDPRVIVTPHAAFVSAESLADLRRRAATQVVERLAGRIPESVVNPSVLS
ncbi:MAG TPA: C-terminal binding protein [Pirellulaceae bacterium]|nr:C-terminal binding protein [Pirellulaceae bacterium]